MEHPDPPNPACARSGLCSVLVLVLVLDLVVAVDCRGSAKPTVLVTGAAGFIGSYVAHHCLE